MSNSTSLAQPSRTCQSALVLFMEHGPQSLMDDDIKPREVPSRLNTSTKAAKARINKSDTRILSPALYPHDFCDKLKQLATLCVEVEQVKQLLRNQVKHRQSDLRHKARVRFAKEVLLIDLHKVIRELKAQQKAATAATVAEQRNNGVDSAMDVDSQIPEEDSDITGNKHADSTTESAMEVDSRLEVKKPRKRRNRKSKKRAALAMDTDTDMDIEDFAVKRKRSVDAVMEDDQNTPASKKAKDALELSDLARNLPTISPAPRPIPENTDKPLLDWYRTFPGA